MALGAACGAGFGFMQGINLTAFAPDGSILVKSDLFQKLFLIGINTGTGALIAMFLFSRSVFGYYLIPIGIKTLINWMPAFLQKGIIGPGFHAFFTFFLAAGTLVLAFRLRSYFSRSHTHRASKQE